MSAPENKIGVLVVDDEASIREFLEIMLKRVGYKVFTADSGKQALEEIKKHEIQVMITDIAMPKMTGIELLTRARQSNPDLIVVVVTAFGSTESAVEAMKLGASDYLTKPFQIDELKLCLENALKKVKLEKENKQLKSELRKAVSFESLIGSSPAMQEVFDLLKRVAPTKSNILILGESGTGKELVAQAIHQNSGDEPGPFVVINCSAIPEPLFESELFGHKKGSFTGAVSDKKGLIEVASGGTLLLDEVGELPQAVQAKLLRTLQEKTIRPVGGTEDIPVNVRIISATNRNLEEDIKTGKFREDLFYRLNVIQVRLPPLRERRGDISLLAEHFLRKHNLAMGKSIKSISNEAMDILLQHQYPGNVRELENLVERAVALETKPSIFPESLPGKIVHATEANMPIPAVRAAKGIPGGFDLEQQVETLEREYILKALEQTGGVKKRAAQALGISFRSLRYRIEKYGIQDPNPDESE
jgi:two-component system response regulator PilR (NtrC family)